MEAFLTMRRLGHHISLTSIPAIVGKDHVTEHSSNVHKL